MNKILVAVGLFFLVVHCVVSAPNTKEEADAVEKDSDEDSDGINMRDVIKETVIVMAYLENVVKHAMEKCPNLEQKFNETMDEVHQCSLKVDTSSSTVCSGVKDLMAKCSKPLRDLVSECLPVESKGLPLLVHQILVGFVKQACSSTMEETLELLNTCQTERNWSSARSCDNVRNASVLFEKQLPSTDAVCSVIPELKQCSKDLQGPFCKSPITINVFSKFLDSIQGETEAVCKKNVA